jgi:hypothetical protein
MFRFGVEDGTGGPPATCSLGCTLERNYSGVSRQQSLHCPPLRSYALAMNDPYRSQTKLAGLVQVRPNYIANFIGAKAMEIQDV